MRTPLFLKAKSIKLVVVGDLKFLWLAYPVRLPYEAGKFPRNREWVSPPRLGLFLLPPLNATPETDLLRVKTG